jgi:hypothetical protein
MYPTIIIFYDKDGRILTQSYSDSFNPRDVEAEIKLYRPKPAVRVVFDIALPPLD